MRWNGMYVAQQPVEVRAWKKRVAAIKPKTYLEIGSLNGGTLLMLADVFANGATIISIDVAGHGKLIQSILKLGIMGFKAYLLVGDSTAPGMGERITDILGERPVDAAFIDGDHSYACAMSDYLLCFALVRPGGLIGIHDLATKSAGDAVGQSVDKVWKHVQAQHPGKTTEYIVKLPKKRPACGSVGNGIGVVEV